MPSKKKSISGPTRNTYKGDTRVVLVRVRLKERKTNPLFPDAVSEILLENCSDIIAVEDVTFPEGMYGDNGEFEDE